MARTIANVLVGVVTISVNPTAGTAVGGAGWVDLGYTEDGVEFIYDVVTADIRTLAQTFPVKRIISREDIEVVCQMAEATLANLNRAMLGGVLAAPVLTLDAGAVKEFALKLVGTGPDDDLPTRTVYIPYCTAVGRMRQAYRRASKTLVPVTFKAFRNATDVCTITDTV